ncbi:hypothetical protein P691DRAFT_333686 [Macrolepiota fuliginosa MF-IS2]|uniref:Nephrocystin 3-like N-terminal domain-containing protein n=1 Tax=Macrolepiota fuliginosa MF-IS2 TaxID=1400762 RepID=A0A9P5X750_9AGAR|nr:hypothetical protein P691DRAFT_333686 [Macrolepiota fuliginosa MF-IS2]
MLLRLFPEENSLVLDPNSDEPQIPPDNASSSYFSGARNFTVNQPTMIEKMQTNIYTGKTVFEALLPFCSIGAMADSSARDPPPRCHPKTRQSVRERLLIWPRSKQNNWKMKWLHGSPGVGKSAVAQTFAEDCQAGRCLGGAFFFSRLKGFDKPLQVIPTLAYQLAVNLPGYKAILGQLLADDPVVLQKAIHIQFRKLIVEPLSTMTSKNSSSVQWPCVMILDGLDECEGESAQCEIIEMISEVTRLRSDLPLLWLICSRSEYHLKMTFSQADFMINCGQEELFIDHETRADVDRYLRDGFQKIRAKYRDVITSESWPDEHSILRVQHIASGLFILASSALEYVQDPGHANPEGQLRSLLLFFQGTNCLASNPLTALDLLYTHILSAIPDNLLPIILQILYVYIRAHCSPLGRCISPEVMVVLAAHRKNPCEVEMESREYFELTMGKICKFLRLDENTAYNSLRKLHSVIRIPTPEKFQRERLRVHHLSFLDFLQHPVRSGKFYLSQALPQVIECSLFWCAGTLTRPVTVRRQCTEFHGKDNVLELCFRPWSMCRLLGTRIPTTLSHRLYEFPYNLLPGMEGAAVRFANWLYDLDSPMPNNFLRTQPYYEADLKLLDYLWAVTDPLESLDPASFPIDVTRRAKYPFRCESIYFLLGHGSKSCLVYVSFETRWWCEGILNLGPQPTMFRGKCMTYQDVDWEEARRRGDTYQASVGSAVGPLVAE